MDNQELLDYTAKRIREHESRLEELEKLMINTSSSDKKWKTYSLLIMDLFGRKDELELLRIKLERRNDQTLQDTRIE